MATNIEMPKLSDTMTEGTLIKWHKQVGDEVEIGDVIAEVETDKATMEMEAFDEGTLTSIEVQEGEKAPIGVVLAVLDGDGSGAAAKASTAEPEPTATASPTEPEPSAAQPSAAPAASTAEGGRIKASPLARKVAADLGVDLATLTGTGPGGRIIRDDVEKASKAGATQPTSQATAAANLAQAAKDKAATPAAPQPQAIQPTVRDEDETIELTSMRRIIADRLLVSKQTIPHFYLHVEVDAEPLMKMRKEVNGQAEKTHGNKYSVNDFILKAAICAAGTVPAVNASFTGDAIVRFAHIGMSVAIAVDDGLVTPVIKNAETKSLLQISKEVKDLAARARDKKLKPNEFDGGTITVSNLGAWGVESFDAIVNPPQALIVSVGGAIPKPVVKDGAIVPGLRMNLGISCDHRVVDGAVAAEYLAEMKKLIEQPALMLI
jgi:pyruvate dehydrogenase E2 component (dihydrolipoamide acetyltransferase)